MFLVNYLCTRTPFEYILILHTEHHPFFRLIVSISMSKFARFLALAPIVSLQQLQMTSDHPPSRKGIPISYISRQFRCHFITHKRSN
jgi:hypothetical protein